MIKYARVLWKLSGEGLGSQNQSIDPQSLKKITTEVKGLLGQGVQVAIVLGAGNIFRGLTGAAQGMDRTTADYMGMLATVINGLALQDALRQAGLRAHVQSAIEAPTVCEKLVREKAIRSLEKGEVVIFVAGTGNPYFTTDTAGVLRALEMNCHAVLKSTSVDGIYTADPKKDPAARFLKTISYTDFLEQKLRVMDATAVALARDAHLPILVFNQHQSGLIQDIVRGEGTYSVIE